ncbi:MAG: OmpA family protein [Pseudomonadota bacterium]
MFRQVFFILAAQAAGATGALAQAQFSAQDIIDHFSRSEAAAAPAGVVIGGEAAQSERIDLSAIGRSRRGTPSGTDGFQIPLTGAARTDQSGQPQTEPTQVAAARADAAPVSGGYDLLVTFEINSDRLTQQAQQNLDEFARALLLPALSSAVFIVEGHTDASGSDATNLALSERRASSVVLYLSQQGVDATRLEAQGFGETRPLHTDPADPRNRRVQTRRIR